MKNHPVNLDRTHGKKGIIIFAAVSFVLAIAMVILFIFLKDENTFVRGFVIAAGSIFAVIALIVLLIQLTVYLEIKGERLVYHSFFTKRTYKVSQVTKIVYNNGAYAIFVDKDRILFVLDTSDVAAQSILNFLERHKIEVIYK